MFSAKLEENLNNNINNNNGNNIIISTITSNTNQANQNQQSFAYSTTTNTACSSTMLSGSSSLILGQNGNTRDRTHLSLDLRDLKPREPSNSGLSPISLPMSLLDSTLLMSPEKILLAAQHHQQQLQQGTKLETPTPSNFIFPKNVTTEQETFAQGFQKALQKLQGDTSLPTFQNNSPSTVKFLLSLAALTPTLSPSVPNKNLLGQQIQSDLNNLVGTEARKLELPKIVLNNPVIPTTTQADLNNQTASDLAKKYMEYFQIGQTSIGRQNNIDFQVPQFQPSAQHIPSSSTSTINVNDCGQSQQNQKGPLNQSTFIKKEPAIIFGNEQNELLSLGAEASPIIAPQVQLLNGSIQVNNDANHRQQQQSSSNGIPNIRRKDSMSSSGEQMGEHDIKKLERKRARNRLAASKCRQRKLQRISDLENEVEKEKERGNELEKEISRLQIIIKRLQEQLNNAKRMESSGRKN